MSNFWKSVAYTILGIGSAYVAHRWPWAAPVVAGTGTIVAGHLPGWSNEDNGGKG